MGLAVKLSDAPFRDVEQAIWAAYRAEAVAIVKTSSVFANLRGGTVRAREAITPHDKLAQASYTRALMLKTLPEHLRDAVDAYFTVPEGINLDGRKENACAHLSWRVYEDMGEVPNRAYLLDLARGWAGNRRERTDTEWAKHLSKTARTVYGWKLGTHERAGALKRMDLMKEEAIKRLQDVFQDAGVCG